MVEKDIQTVLDAVKKSNSAKIIFILNNNELTQAVDFFHGNLVFTKKVKNFELN